jgi:hypothetical protein
MPDRTAPPQGTTHHVMLGGLTVPTVLGVPQDPLFGYPGSTLRVPTGYSANAWVGFRVYCPLKLPG